MSFNTRITPGASCPVPEQEKPPVRYGKTGEFIGGALDTVKTKAQEYLDPHGLLPKEIEKPSLVAQKAVGTPQNEAAAINKALQDIYKDKSIINNVNYGEINNKAVDLLFSGKFVDSTGGKAIFEGFDKKLVNNFKNDLLEFKVSPVKIDEIIENLTKARQVFTDFGNKLNIKNFGKNFPEVMQMLKDRAQGFGASEIKIYEDSKLQPMYNAGPLADARQRLKDILVKNTQDVKLAQGDMDIMLDNISRATLNKATRTYEFEYRDPFASPKENPIKQINLKDFYDYKGKFKGNELIRNEQQLKALRDYLGENKNVAKTIYNTVYDLSGIVSRDAAYTKLLQDAEAIKAKTGKTILSDTFDEVAKSNPNQKIRRIEVKLPIADEFYHTPLANKEGLGLWTTEAIADAIEFSDKLPFASIVKQGWYQNFFIPLNSMISGLKTVVNPFRQILNWGQYFIMGIGNGALLKNPVFLLEESKRALGATLIDKNYASIFKKMGYNALEKQMLKLDGKTFKLVDIMNEEGIKMSHPVARNFEAMLAETDWPKRMEALKNGDVKVAFKGIKSAQKYIFDKASGTYQIFKDVYISSDEFFKYLNTLSEFDTIKTIYQGSNLAKSLIPTEEEMFRMACGKTRRMMPNFNMSNRLEQIFRRNPFMGNFIMWPSQAARNVIAIAREGIIECQNPLFRAQGIKRLMALSTTLGGLTYAGAKGYNALHGITDDVEAAARRFAPKWMGLSSLGMTENERGNYTVTDVNHVNPYTIITGPFTSMMARIISEKVEDPDAFILQGMLPGFFEGVAKEMEPFFAVKLPIAGVYEAVRNTTSLGQPIFNVSDDWEEKFYKISEHIWQQTFEPAGISQMNRLFLAASGKPGPKGENYYLSNEAWGIIGLRKIEIDPLQSFDSKVSEYLRNQSYVSGEMRNFFGSQDRPNINLTEDEIIQEYLKLNQLMYDAKSNLKLDYNAAKTLGLDDSKIYARQKNQHNLLNEINSNNFVPFETFIKELQNYALYVQEKQRNAIRPEEINIPDINSLIQKINQMNMNLRTLNLNSDINNVVNIRDYLDNTGILSGTIASVEKLASQVNLPYKQQETNSLNS